MQGNESNHRKTDKEMKEIVKLQEKKLRDLMKKIEAKMVAGFGENRTNL